MNARILCVDDEPSVLAACQRTLRRHFVVDVAGSGPDALQRMSSSLPYAVLIADMKMPGMSGVELLAETARLHPDTVRIMLTGNADQQTAVAAVNAGQIFRFLNKPCAPEALIGAIRDGVRQHKLIVAERELLEGTLRGAVTALTEILSSVDPTALGMDQALQERMRRLLSGLNRPVPRWEFEMAALLSQIGCVAVPQSVLRRARDGQGLTEAEKHMLERLPGTGADLLKPIPRLEGVARAILYQRKNYDGSGFPRDEIAGEEIPLASRILRILIDLQHAEDAALAPRGQEFALLRQRKGAYDPQILEAAAAFFHSSPAAPPHARLLRVGDLMVDQVLASNVEACDGTLLIPAGQRLNAVLLEKIRNFATVMGVCEPIAVI